jgi:hypothetical protein
MQCNNFERSSETTSGQKLNSLSSLEKAHKPLALAFFPSKYCRMGCMPEADKQ